MRTRNTASGVTLILAAAVVGAVGGTNDFECDNLTVVSNITQTSASGTASFMGKVGIGTASPDEALHVDGDSKFEGNIALAWPKCINGDGDVNEGLKFTPSGKMYLQNSKGGGAPSIETWRHGEGGTSVGNNDVLLLLTVTGKDGLGHLDSVVIKAIVDGTVSSNNVPGKLVFRTRPSGGDDTVERMVIKNDGKIGIGTNTPSETCHIFGTLRADQGITYVPALGDLSMGTYTNEP